MEKIIKMILNYGQKKLYGGEEGLVKIKQLWRL